jgi:hypothetical protein
MKSEEEYFKAQFLYLQSAKYNLFDDFVEIIMNFGYLSIFASAFNRAPVLVYIFNYLEF